MKINLWIKLSANSNVQSKEHVTVPKLSLEKHPHGLVAVIVKNDDPDSERGWKDQVAEVDAEIVWEGLVVLAGFQSQSGIQDDVDPKQTHNREVDGEACQSMAFKLG